MRWPVFLSVNLHDVLSMFVTGEALNQISEKSKLLIIKELPQLVFISSVKFKFKGSLDTNFEKTYAGKHRSTRHHRN